MRQLWSIEAFGEHWILMPGDLALLSDLADASKFGLAAQLA